MNRMRLERRGPADPFGQDGEDEPERGDDGRRDDDPDDVVGDGLAGLRGGEHRRRSCPARRTRSPSAPCRLQPDRVHDRVADEHAAPSPRPVRGTERDDPASRRSRRSAAPGAGPAGRRCAGRRRGRLGRPVAGPTGRLGRAAVISCSRSPSSRRPRAARPWRPGRSSLLRKSCSSTHMWALVPPPNACGVRSDRSNRSIWALTDGAGQLPGRRVGVGRRLEVAVGGDEAAPAGHRSAPPRARRGTPSAPSRAGVSLNATAWSPAVTTAGVEPLIDGQSKNLAPSPTFDLVRAW